MSRGVRGQEMLEIERLKLSRCDRVQHRSAQAVQEEPKPRPALRARGRSGALEGFGRRAQSPLGPRNSPAGHNRSFRLTPAAALGCEDARCWSRGSVRPRLYSATFAGTSERRSATLGAR